MKKISGVFVLILASMSLLAAGCGGDDNSSDAPTKTEFITQADKICTDGDTALTAEVTKTFKDGQPSKKEAVAFTKETVVPNYTDQLNQLRALTPPDGDEDSVNAVWDALESGISTIDEDPEAAFSNTNPLQDAADKANEYGFKSCGV